MVTVTPVTSQRAQDSLTLNHIALIAPLVDLTPLTCALPQMLPALQSPVIVSTLLSLLVSPWTLQQAVSQEHQQKMSAQHRTLSRQPTTQAPIHTKSNSGWTLLIAINVALLSKRLLKLGQKSEVTNGTSALRDALGTTNGSEWSLIRSS